MIMWEGYALYRVDGFKFYEAFEKEDEARDNLKINGYQYNKTEKLWINGNDREGLILAKVKITPPTVK